MNIGQELLYGRAGLVLVLIPTGDPRQNLVLLPS